MTPRSRSLLMHAGWKPGRRIDPTAQLAALRAEGYEVPIWIQDHLSEFDELDIEFECYSYPDHIVLSTVEAVRTRYKASTDGYSASAGTLLLPIGYSSQGHLLWLVSSDGRVFGGYDAVFGLLGRDIFEAIDRVASNEGFLEELW